MRVLELLQWQKGTSQGEVMLNNEEIKLAIIEILYLSEGVSQSVKKIVK